MFQTLTLHFQNAGQQIVEVLLWMGCFGYYPVVQQIFPKLNLGHVGASYQQMFWSHDIILPFGWCEVIHHGSIFH